MKNLFTYSFLVNEVFYKCEPILEWIKNNPDMSKLDKKAIKATIMDALVYKGLVNPEKESLDLENLTIWDDLEHYVYEKYPDVCGIPLWMKEEFRKKSLKITCGVPISIFLSKPPSKKIRYCVYDPNTAVSSIFPDATFYNVIYKSPTRNKILEDVRPFVEVLIDKVPYLVDTLTKRIFKSSYFKENYGFQIINQKNVQTMNERDKKIYDHMVSKDENLNTYLLLMSDFLNISNNDLSLSELKYEIEKSKEYYPLEWQKYLENKKEMDLYFKRVK